MTLDVNQVPTPCYILEEEKLEKNLAILDRVQQESGAKILLALKGFAMWSTFATIGKVLHGTAASGLHEARLGYEEMGNEVHTFSPAFTEKSLQEIIQYSDHIVFNSFSQWEHLRHVVEQTDKAISCGLRINPEYSEVEPPIYNPCVAFSRFGVTRDQFQQSMLDGLDGLHFHTHCEQNADALQRTLSVVEEKFGEFISRMKWINFGGGHHITRADYDVDGLIETIKDFRNRYQNIEVYLEPGEAIGWHTGPLVASVVDILHNGMDIAIIDASAAAHMPDVLEMPYRPEVRGASEPGDFPYTYRLGGNTCLAGDVIGDYSFPQRLQPGDRIVFEDMTHYTMVKNNTFNGVPLPTIAKWCKDNKLEIIKQFGYEDYRMRLS
ncbi:carboxynorspermidine decarboxylase [Desulfurispira natronophila]|uniref:Carboxynorspermidine/carboxyspermidine decarboxylase n=1 Tax=Desulfurispira natronophila TaxID=682562 RepID=A0A7W8DHR1_9BACT|nr:carboxynorspermidine decarboxylase [Desulfurispira natronophila]MBB5022622.1 carboxynorspermidine decarboxylase [Desulfurispira natronophila]